MKSISDVRVIRIRARIAYTGTSKVEGIQKRLYGVMDPGHRQADLAGI